MLLLLFCHRAGAFNSNHSRPVQLRPSHVKLPGFCQLKIMLSDTERGPVSVFRATVILLSVK